MYNTDHPDGTSHAGSAIIIKESIKHFLPEYRSESIQATTISLQKKLGAITMSAVYCPPKSKYMVPSTFEYYFETLGNTFIAGGDWNSKHTFWGSRAISTRGRKLKTIIYSKKLRTFSTGEPTYWPTDPAKRPDLLDFFITRGLSEHYFSVESSLDGPSDHTPVLLTLSKTIVDNDNPRSIYNEKTDWESFRQILDQQILLNVSMKSAEDVENASWDITNKIQNAV